MSMKIYTTHHLIKSAELNHHGTLYAGLTAEWFVESGFVAAAALTRPENILCLKIHGMLFTKPVEKGTVVRFESRVCLTGKSRIISYIQMFAHEEPVLEGFITFVNSDEQHKPLPHGIIITAETPEEQTLQERAKALSLD